jgi:hypothetical protein
MKLFVERKRRIDESIDSPCEGIFWFINQELVAFTEQVDTSGRLSTDLEHKKIWNIISERYKISGKKVPYNYYPCGRVMVNPRYVNGSFDNYEAFIYIDDCINNSEYLEDIYYEFRLNKNCVIKYIGSEGGVTSDHYTCHKCSGR